LLTRPAEQIRGIDGYNAFRLRKSMAILDALKAPQLPMVEMHITNIHRREPIYHKSYVTLAAIGVICGLGVPDAVTRIQMRHAPELLNAATGVANASLDSVPMVVIAGDVPTHYHGKYPHQEVSTFMPTRRNTRSIVRS